MHSIKLLQKDKFLITAFTN